MRLGGALVAATAAATLAANSSVIAANCLVNVMANLVTTGLLVFVLYLRISYTFPKARVACKKQLSPN